MSPSTDPTFQPSVPIRTLGFAAFRLLDPAVGTTAQKLASSPSSLLSRSPGQSVIAESLRLQDDEPPRAWWQRLVGSSPLGASGRSWFHGALGEIAVGQILRGLGSEWTVLHAVPVGAGASDIDHVLVGPAGVFTLNTKNHAGKKVWVGERAILVDGHRQHYLSHARHEAARAAKRLSAVVGEQVPVTPVLVLIEPKDLTIKQRPAGVHVITDRRLLRWLRRRRPALAPEQVARITAAAVVPKTWHNSPPPSGDPIALQERFDGLRASVRSARRRRALWELALLIGGVAAAVNTGPDLLAALLGAGPGFGANA